MNDARNEAERAVAPLLTADEEELFAELGIRARGLVEDPSQAGSFDPDVTYSEAEMGVLDAVRAFGRRLFNRWNSELHSLLCGSDPDYTADREQIANALGVGETAVAAALVTVLVGSLGLAPALATVIAAIIVRRFFKPTLEEFCQTWSRALA